MLDIYGVTDIGCVREHNEDWIGWKILPSAENEAARCLAVLADGMGGYSGGAEASRIAGEQFIRSVASAIDKIKPISNDEYAKLLTQAGAEANNSVREARALNYEHHKMGTTLLAMLLLKENYWLVHVGDSRCYRAREGELQQMTQDHSLVQELLDSGSLTEKEAERAPFRNMLTRAVGTEPNLRFAIAKHRLQQGETWMLCSDGLYNAVSEPVIGEWLNSNLCAEEIATGLLQDSLKNNAQDNVSIIVLQQNTQQEG